MNGKLAGNLGLAARNFALDDRTTVRLIVGHDQIVIDENTKRFADVAFRDLLKKDGAVAVEIQIHFR